MRWERANGGWLAMPDPTSSTPPRTPAAETADSGQGSPYKVCQELTIAEVVDLVARVTDGGVELTAVRDSPLMKRKVLLELSDGEAPAGGLVRVRMQRQTVRDGTVRWTPER